MLLYVYDKAVTLLGIVEKITSLIWTEKKYSCGTFEMLLPVENNNIELLQESRLIIRDDDPEHIAGEILYRQIKKSIDGSETLEVTGKLLENWFDDRLQLRDMDTVAKPQALMAAAVLHNCCVAAAGNQRGFPLLEIGTATETRPQTALNYKNETNLTVLATLEALAAATDTGFNINVDIVAKRFKFNTYTGEDHTINSQNPCIFSVDYDNILEQEYTQSVENKKNVAYVYGEEASTATLPVIVGAAAGHARKEVYINASGVKQDELTAEEYAAVLATNGEIALQQYTETLNFFNKINTATGSFKYGDDYKLGDKVTCINSRWRVAIDAVITEAQTTYEKGQKTIYLTFGEALPSLSETIKKLNKR